MFDSAFASLATSFSGISGAPFNAATVSWRGKPTLDSGGSIIAAGTPESYGCQVQFDVVTNAMRGADGFLETDVRMLVLAAGLARPVDTEAKIAVASGKWAGTWQVLSAQTDPAGIGYDCGGRKVA